MNAALRRRRNAPRPEPQTRARTRVELERVQSAIGAQRLDEAANELGGLRLVALPRKRHGAEHDAARHPSLGGVARARRSNRERAE